MTSVLRRYAQMDPRTQYFFVLSSPVPCYVNESTSINTSQLMTITDVSNAFLATTPQLPDYTTGNLLKDMGRQITVYDPTIAGSPHIAIFRQVMLVNGFNVEGIPNSNNQPPPFVPTNSFAYICTWVDDSGRPPPFVLADVARTG
jgi:hypothetical protein